LRFDEVLFRIRYSQILEHIAAAGFVSLAGHRLVFFASCSASRSRR
jgi:hypothetical protein